MYSPRLVSTTVARDVDSPSETETTWVMQYGQFIDHDFTKTPEFRTGKEISNFAGYRILLLNPIFKKPMEVPYLVVCRTESLLTKN